MILRILVVLAAAIVGVLILAAAKPNTFQIERSLNVKAPPEEIYGLIDDFHNWPKWAPQDREDSSLKRTFRGAISGAGAICDWEGRGNSGKGTMTIVESDAPRRVVVQVHWVSPFNARNMNEFTLEPEGASTKVTWKMNGPNLCCDEIDGCFYQHGQDEGKTLRGRLK